MGVAENAINNMVIISRNMMIHGELRWTDTSEHIICTMAMSHDFHLQNHTPYISSGMSPEEVLTRSKSSHSDLQNSPTWGCPEYVLEPRLQDGNKFTKWMSRSRRAQYLGVSPLHASTVGMVRNP